MACLPFHALNKLQQSNRKEKIEKKNSKESSAVVQLDLVDNMDMQEAREFLHPLDITVVAYHGRCNDGYAAASAIHRLGIRPQFVPCFYADVMPESLKQLKPTDNVLMVDYSLKRPLLLELASRVNKLLVLDHHKTAQEDLENINGLVESLRDEMDNSDSGVTGGSEEQPIQKSQIHAVFDMNRCGAVMAWHYAWPDLKLPRCYELVQDRDLWTQLWPVETKLFYNHLISQPQELGDFAKYEDLNMLQEVMQQAKVLADFQESLVKSAAVNARKIRFLAQDCMAINTTVLQSELGNHLCTSAPVTAPMAFLYFIHEAKQSIIISLRSRPGVDVSAIAKIFGGGGHAQAAGMSLPASVHLPSFFATLANIPLANPEEIRTVMREKFGVKLSE